MHAGGSEQISLVLLDGESGSARSFLLEVYSHSALVTHDSTGDQAEDSWKAFQFSDGRESVSVFVKVAGRAQFAKALADVAPAVSTKAIVVCLPENAFLTIAPLAAALTQIALRPNVASAFSRVLVVRPPSAGRGPDLDPLLAALHQQFPSGTVATTECQMGLEDDLRALVRFLATGEVGRAIAISRPRPGRLRHLVRPTRVLVAAILAVSLAAAAWHHASRADPDVSYAAAVLTVSTLHVGTRALQPGETYRYTVEHRASGLPVGSRLLVLEAMELTAGSGDHAVEIFGDPPPALGNGQTSHGGRFLIPKSAIQGRHSLRYRLSAAVPGSPGGRLEAVTVVEVELVNGKQPQTLQSRKASPSDRR